MTFQRELHYKNHNSVPCAAAACLSQQVSEKAARERGSALGFVTVSEHNAGKTAWQLAFLLAGCNRVTFAVPQLPAFPSRAAGSAAAAHAPELGSAHRPLHALLHSEGLQFHI